MGESHYSHVQRLWTRLAEEEKEIALEKARVKDVWQMILDAHKKNEETKKANNETLFEFVEPSTRMVLNVGGQLFETTAGLLTKDRYSVLAALCRKKDTPLSKNKQGQIFIDRDWWIFRYILQFLREGTVPDDPGRLKELYTEATFYKLASLQRAIQAAVVTAAGYCRADERPHLVSSILATSRPASASPVRMGAGRDKERRRVTVEDKVRANKLPDPFGHSSHIIYGGRIYAKI